MKKKKGNLALGTKWSISFHTTDLSPTLEYELMLWKGVDIPFSIEKKNYGSKTSKMVLQSSDFCLSVQDKSLLITFASLQLFCLFLNNLDTHEK
jgi:hypothetical protein